MTDLMDMFPCYGEFCHTIDKDLPIYCPNCMAKHFHRLTEEDLMEMYMFFEEQDIPEEHREIFFDAFNKLLLIKRSEPKL